MHAQTSPGIFSVRSAIKSKKSSQYRVLVSRHRPRVKPRSNHLVEEFWPRARDNHLINEQPLLPNGVGGGGDSALYGGDIARHRDERFAPERHGEPHFDQ